MTRRGAAGQSLDVSPPVADALAAAAPVVALESTLIAHGLPYPLNLEAAGEMMGAIRREGAVPALIAVLDGRIRIGLEASELARIASDDRIAKAGARDVPILVATGASGATTVAGTMFCARLAGIEVFATGGIGGVHRGASSTFDVSADLYELARTPVAVVCSGAKSILDVPATLEMLESLGVPVLGLATTRFPAFHLRDSGLPVPHPVQDAREAARVAAAVLALERTGLVVANPVSAEEAMDRETVEHLVEQAERGARTANVAGKALTPFLLDALAASSGGATLRTNRALLVDNARAAAEVAGHLAAARTSGAVV
ncbi:MAG: pseudouridine-5'-phosphate glycosidase [Thiotrichales bacterium]|nr:pseudouridine-5'-phosphate glycosidase [Thiotrichales bacterium]